jgi:hypothetical protein
MAALSSLSVGLKLEYLDLKKLCDDLQFPPFAHFFVGFSSRSKRNSSRVILLRAMFAPQWFRLRPLEDADEDDRARLEIPDEMLEMTEAHDLRRKADFVDGVDFADREGDFSRGELSGVAVDSALALALTVVADGGVDPAESVVCLVVAVVVGVVVVVITVMSPPYIVGYWPRSTMADRAPRPNVSSDNMANAGRPSCR